MIEARPASLASLRAAIVRRPAPLALPAPEASPVPPSRRADLRFFLTCYAAGLIFFLVMLS